MSVGAGVGIGKLADLESGRRGIEDTKMRSNKTVTASCCEICTAPRSGLGSSLSVGRCLALQLGETGAVVRGRGYRCPLLGRQ